MDGKIVFITGSTKGIGYAAAQEFLHLGAKVLVNGRNADACREACQKLSGGVDWPVGICWPVVGDISTPEGRDQVVRRMREICESLEYPCIDCLVNNAGTNVRAPALEADARDYRRIMDCLLYTSPSPRDKRQSRMPSSA